jgi:hypothetical protein
MSTDGDPAHPGDRDAATGRVARKRWSTPRVIMSTLASRGTGAKPTNVPDTSANAGETVRGAS